MCYGTDDSSSSHSSDSEGMVLEKDNIAPHFFATESYRRLMQDSALTHLMIEEERNEIEHNIQRVNSQLQKLENEIVETQSTDNHHKNGQNVFHLIFKLNDDNDIERFKSADFTNWSRIDLYNIPLNSKAVLNFWENNFPDQLDTFCFNLNGKDIDIEKYIKALFKNLSCVKVSFSLNHCLFKESSMTYLMQDGANLLSHLQLLDLSYCQGISIELLAEGMPIFKHLKSLVMHHCGFEKEESIYFISLFYKIPFWIYLDLRFNNLDLETIAKNLILLPELNYLFVKRNEDSDLYIENLRNYGYTGLVDPWEP